MSKLEQNNVVLPGEILNNPNFKFLAFWISIVSIPIALIAPAFSVLMITVMAIYSFIKDREFLKKQNVYVPHWGWYFLIPVYIFKRQRHNNLGLKWFWLYWVGALAAVFVTAVLTSLLSQYGH